MLRSETAGDAASMARALKGLRAYQKAERMPPLPLMPVIAEAQGAKLRNYGGTGRTVLFVPSLINPPSVLDLSHERSLLRWLAARGHRILLLDWGWDAGARRSISVAGHVEEIVLPFIDGLEEAPALVGYCLGGTMAVAAASVASVRGVATIAAPWHFSGFPEEARAMLLDLWVRSKPLAASLGLLPMEVLQSAFWSLDPERTVRKFAEFSAMPPESDEARSFVTLEDWANDGPPLGEEAAHELFEGFFGEDKPGKGGWRVAGASADPSALSCPLLNIVSTSDRIVPHATAIRHGERLDLDQGHVGMVIGGRARNALWEPLDNWFSRLS